MSTLTVNSVTTNYTYYADGLRRTKTTNGVTTVHMWDGKSFLGIRWVDAPYFSDVLRPETAKTVATFNDTYYAGKPAMTANAYGDGTAYYFGAGFSVENAADLIEYFGLQPLCAELVTCSKNIQFASREDAKEAYWFFANYKDCEEKFVVNGTVADLISGESFSGECTLAPYQVVVVKAKK